MENRQEVLVSVFQHPHFLMVITFVFNIHKRIIIQMKKLSLIIRFSLSGLSVIMGGVGGGFFVLWVAIEVVVAELVRYIKEVDILVVGIVTISLMKAVKIVINLTECFGDWVYILKLA